MTKSLILTNTIWLTESDSLQRKKIYTALHMSSIVLKFREKVPQTF